MEHPCHRCGHLVEDGTAFCAHCGAPQIRVTIEVPPGAVAAGASVDVLSTGPSIAGFSSHSPGSILWRQGFPSAAMAGVIAGLGMAMVGLFGLWMIAGGFLSIVFYRRRTHGELLRARAGARLGALTGGLGFVTFALITVPSGFFRVMMAELVRQYQQRSDPALRAMADSWLELLKTPAGLTAWLACLLLLSLLAASLGGALGGAWLGRRHRQ